MLWGTVSRLRETAELLDETGQRLSGIDPGPTAFGAGGLGLLGDVGHEVYRQWRAALEARSREASEHASRTQALAQAVTAATGALSGADADAPPEVR